MGTGTGSIDLSTLNNLHTNLTQHFWFNSNTGVAYGTGVHMTLSSQAEFIANPTGQNILMNTDGISIRNGTVPLMVLDNDSLDFNVVVDLEQGTYSNVATFGATGFRMGVIADGETRLVANGAGVDLIRRKGTSDTTLAHFGYDYGTPEQSGQPQVQNPYYTFGYRSPNYNVGNWSVAEGDWTVASGFASHAEGSETIASELCAHAEGIRTVASGTSSHCGGGESTASGEDSFAHGYALEASYSQEFVIGRFNDTSLSQIQIIYTCDENDYDKATLSFQNSYGVYGADFNITYNGEPIALNAVSWDSTTITITANFLPNSHFMDGDEIGVIFTMDLPLFVIGNGNADKRSNAVYVDLSGNIKANGKVYTKCLANSAGTAYIGQRFNWQGNLKSNLTANADAYVEGNGSITLKGGHTYLILAYVGMTNSTNGSVNRKVQIFNKTANTSFLTGAKFVASQVWGTVETQTLYDANQDVTLTVRGSASRPTTTIPTAWIRAVCIA